MHYLFFLNLIKIKLMYSLLQYSINCCHSLHSMDDTSEEPNLEPSSHNMEDNKSNRPQSIDSLAPKNRVIGMSCEQQNESEVRHVPDEVDDENTLEHKYRELCLQTERQSVKATQVTPPNSPTKQASSSVNIAPNCGTSRDCILAGTEEEKHELNKALPDTMALPMCTKGRLLCHCAYCSLRKVLTKEGHPDNAYHRQDCPTCKSKMNLARELGVKRIVAVFLIHCPILGEIQEADVATFQLINLVAGAIGESIFKLEDNLAYIDRDTYFIDDDTTVQGYVMAVCSIFLAEKLRKLEDNYDLFFQISEARFRQFEDMNLLRKFRSLEHFVQTARHVQAALDARVVADQKERKQGTNTVADDGLSAGNGINADENYSSDDSVFYLDDVTQPKEKQVVRPWRSKRVVVESLPEKDSGKLDSIEKRQCLKRSHDNEVDQSMEARLEDKENTTEEGTSSGGWRNRPPMKVSLWPPSKKFKPSKRKFDLIFDQPVPPKPASGKASTQGGKTKVNYRRKAKSTPKNCAMGRGKSVSSKMVENVGNSSKMVENGDDSEIEFIPHP